MQAIQTKFIGPTNTHGARIKATCEAGSTTIAYDYSIGSSEEERQHQRAAQALAIKLGWLGGTELLGDLVSGRLPDGTYAHVFVPENTYRG